MSQLLLNQQSSSPGTPAASKAGLYVSNDTNPLLKVVNPAGAVLTVPYYVYNNSTADQTLTTGADTYITGATLAVPANMTLVAGTALRWVISVSKTGVSTTAPVFNVRCGTGVIGDTALAAITGVAQTAVIDTGVIEINTIVRVATSTGTASSVVFLTHNLATTGLANVAAWGSNATSSSFNFTTANLVFGISLNPAGTAVWTVQSVFAEMRNLG